MKEYNIMTPGPTKVRENVRLARARQTTNPDLDLEFYDFYKNICEKISKIFKTKNPSYILSGEGILGLEAACASLTEQGDRVLVIDNGIFGEGFADFVTMYGGEVVFFKGDRYRGIDIGELEAFLEKDHNFKYATVVHCDTPSGVLNDLSKICPLLKKRGIITVVDTVAAVGGMELETDRWGIDIALGGSQKAFSAPAGLTMVTISDDAFKVMEGRKTKIPAFYCNLLIWKDYYKDKWFPYTMPISDIIGLSVAIDNIHEEGVLNVINRHKEVAEFTRETVLNMGLKLHLKEDFSDTVTVINVPEGITASEIIESLKSEYGIFIAGSFGYLQGRVLRIGHMGENARMENAKLTMMALKELLISKNIIK